MLRTITYGTMALVLVGLSPYLAGAKPPGGKGGGGHSGIGSFHSGGSHKGGAGPQMTFKSGNFQHHSGHNHHDHHDHWKHGHWHHGHGYPWYGYSHQYPGYGSNYYYGDSYSVARPIVENPAPGPAFSGGPILVTNPSTNNATLNYTLNGHPYTIAPGQTQELREDRAWVIEFSRGQGHGGARYQLGVGRYAFAPTEVGWELHRYPLETAASPVAPAPPPR